jgi:hypothetical protein
MKWAADIGSFLRKPFALSDKQPSSSPIDWRVDLRSVAIHHQPRQQPGSAISNVQDSVTAALLAERLAWSTAGSSEVQAVTLRNLSLWVGHPSDVLPGVSAGSLEDAGYSRIAAEAEVELRLASSGGEGCDAPCCKVTTISNQELEVTLTPTTLAQLGQLLRQAKTMVSDLAAAAPDDVPYASAEQPAATEWLGSLPSSSGHTDERQNAMRAVTENAYRSEAAQPCSNERTASIFIDGAHLLFLSSLGYCRSTIRISQQLQVQVAGTRRCRTSLCRLLAVLRSCWTSSLVI